MDFISNREAQIEEMLRSIGVSSVNELFAQIPKNLLRSCPSIDDGLSEFEGMRLMDSLAAKNTFPSFENYLGAGAYEHHVPVVAGAICQKSEFLTAYTPYQAEASQGMLQAIFEFQSAVCALTGLDVSNASLYDGASACAESLLMALRIQNGRNRVVLAGSLHPNYRAVCEQYLSSHHTIMETIPFLPDGQLNLNAANLLIDDTTAAVLVQSPNFFSLIEPVKAIVDKARSTGTLVILCSNPLSFGLYASAGDLGVDIAVGDCQPLGLPMEFGGPYAGYMACKDEFLRQLPGRIVGETVDTQGRRGFILTLQAREQHIRREKATSNICTNQALAALSSLITMLWYGKEGLKKLALTNYQRAAYLKDKLKAIPGIRTVGNNCHFNEFVVVFSECSSKVQAHFRKNGIEPGLHLGRFYPELQDNFLVAVTETKSLEQLDRYVAVARELTS